MPPVTKFAVPEKYKYLEGLGNYHSSEAIPGAIPAVINSPQTPPFGLRTERISGSSFTAPREANLQTWLYRAQSSLQHGEFVPLEVETGFGAYSTSKHITPNSYNWMSIPVPEKAHWINGQQRLGQNGDPAKKEGIAVWLFSVNEDMPERHVFSSLDGETLIVPQAGALDIQTELGKLLVRQNEIVVIPRGVRYRVTLPEGKGARGYICELYQGHFTLPTLGIIGSTGLANQRDFEIPTAFFDGALIDNVAKANNEGNPEWTIVSRLVGKLWHCTQSRTPFDVAGWHGTSYPYKYDLAKFCVLGNSLFDEHDPCLYTVLTARNWGGEPGTAVVDFAIIPPRWNVAEDTYWLPYYHRNTMQEFFGPIIYAQDEEYPFNGGHEFKPFGCGLHASMSTHGATETDFRNARELDTFTPAKLQTEGMTIFLFETERPLQLTDWAFEHAVKNPQTRPRAAKM